LILKETPVEKFFLIQLIIEERAGRCQVGANQGHPDRGWEPYRRSYRLQDKDFGCWYRSLAYDYTAASLWPCQNHYLEAYISSKSFLSLLVTIMAGEKTSSRIQFLPVTLNIS